MKTTMRNALLVAALAAALPAMAQRAAPSPFYFGAGIGGGNLNASGADLTGLQNATLDDTDTTYTVRAGYRFNPYLAVELGYYDFGKYAFHGQGALAVDGTAKAKSFGLSLVGILPIDQWDIYGRIGYASSELKLNASTNLIATPYNADDSQEEATYGVGARWNVSPNWGMFAEWVKNDKIKVDSYVFGVDFRF